MLVVTGSLLFIVDGVGGDAGAVLAATALVVSEAVGALLTSGREPPGQSFSQANRSVMHESASGNVTFSDATTLGRISRNHLTDIRMRSVSSGLMPESKMDLGLRAL